MADSSFMQSNNLNLLLKQQIISQLEETDEETKYRLNNPDRPFEECISINKKTSTSVVKFYCESNGVSQRCEEIKMELANLHVDESVSSHQHKALCESYDLMESLLEHVLQHVECMILEVKSSNRLSLILNTYGVRENQINEEASNSLRKLCEKPETGILEDIKAKLFISLNNCDNIKRLRLEYEQKRNDYHLATKNFKIILEVMNINEKSLNKLKKQLDDVLMNYQHCRCILGQEMPFVLAERTKILAECLNLLGIECDAWIGQRSELSKLLSSLGANIKNEEYVLVKKEMLDIQKVDD